MCVTYLGLNFHARDVFGFSTDLEVALPHVCDIFKFLTDKEVAEARPARFMCWWS